jgi:uncharacterized protein (TIGR03437 family)
MLPRIAVIAAVLLHCLSAQTMIETVIHQGHPNTIDVLGIAVDGSGRLYIADADGRVLRWTEPGGLSVVAGGGDTLEDKPGMRATEARLLLTGFSMDVDSWRPSGGIAVDAAGRLYIAETISHRIRMVDLDGRIWTIAGNGMDAEPREGRATEQPFSTPSHVAVDAGGNVFAVSGNGGKVWVIDPNGEIRSASGSGVIGHPGGLAVTSRGSLYVSDATTRRLYYSPTAVGELQLYLNNLPGAPYGLADDREGGVYVTDSEEHCLRHVKAGGIVETVAGCRYSYADRLGEYLIGGYGGDGGPPGESYLSSPTAVAVDPQGQIYIADVGNLAIRRIRDAFRETRPRFSVEGVLEATTLRGLPVGGGVTALIGMNLVGQEGVFRAEDEPLPKQLAGVTVVVDGVPAHILEVRNEQGMQRILYLSPNSIDPSCLESFIECPSVPTTIAVERDGERSNTVHFTAQEVRPIPQRFFNGVWMSYHADTGVPVYMGAPARPGEWVRMIVAGLGPVREPFELGRRAADRPNPTLLNWRVMVGGLQAEVAYAGHSPGSFGLYEVLFKVPGSLLGGSHGLMLQSTNESFAAFAWIDVSQE